MNQIDIFLSLIRLGIGHSSFSAFPDIDWSIISADADHHCLTAVVVDGIECVSEEQRPPKDVLSQWLGQVMQGYECRYELYKRTISELARWYNSHGYKMMILKGYACSLDWPKPEHRPCGVIDIWLFGKQKEADEVISKEKGIKIDCSHHHHTVFNWRDFSIENHYNFINVHHHKSNAEFEKILKELGQDDSRWVDVCGEKVYLPSANLSALYLQKHLMMHFAAEGITLRQLMDWDFFVEKHSDEINWDWLERTLEEYGMKKLYDVLNAICVGDLGFDVNLFNGVQFDPSLKDRVLNEILSPEFTIEPPSGLIRRIVFKLRRWKRNAWKHQLCYKESMWSAFWSGVLNHLLKPSSI